MAGKRKRPAPEYRQFEHLWRSCHSRGEPVDGCLREAQLLDQRVHDEVERMRGIHIYRRYKSLLLRYYVGSVYERWESSACYDEIMPHLHLAFPLTRYILWQYICGEDARRERRLHWWNRLLPSAPLIRGLLVDPNMESRFG